MNRKRKHPRLLALAKEIVAYKLTHDSRGAPSSCGRDPKDFIWWTAQDSFLWCKDSWCKTIVEMPGFGTYWTPTKLESLWTKRLSHNTKMLLIKEAIAALRKENKVVVNRHTRTENLWKGRRPTDEKKICVYWEYHWCESPLAALAAI
jgi:hypothetical protein